MMKGYFLILNNIMIKKTNKMQQYLKRLESSADNSEGTMESGDHYKNGAEPEKPESREKQ
jgi:hypothetical protein